MKVYLDTCILSRLVDDKMPEEQLEALEKIAEKETVYLVTSKKTLEEFEKTTSLRKRRHLKVLFRIIQRINAPSPKTHYSGLWGGAPWGVMRWGEGSKTVVQATYAALETVFDKADAEHIYYAKESGCDYFITLDYKTIIRRYMSKQKEVDVTISPLRISDPKGLLDQSLF